MQPLKSSQKIERASTRSQEWSTSFMSLALSTLVGIGTLERSLSLESLLLHTPPEHPSRAISCCSLRRGVSKDIHRWTSGGHHSLDLRRLAVGKGSDKDRRRHWGLVILDVGSIGQSTSDNGDSLIRVLSICTSAERMPPSALILHSVSSSEKRPCQISTRNLRSPLEPCSLSLPCS